MYDSERGESSISLPNSWRYVAATQTAIVTGTSTGIGFATAMRLAREGGRVYATVRSEGSGAAPVDAAGDLPLGARLGCGLTMVDDALSGGRA